MWVAALLLLVGWLMPLHFPPWLSWHSEVPTFAAVFGAACVASLVHAFRAGWGRAIPVPAAALAFAALAVAVALQLAAGQIEFSGDAVILGLYMAFCAMALTLGYAQGRKSKAARGLAGTEVDGPLLLLSWVLVTAAAASAIIALAQVLEIWESATWIARMFDARRPGGNIAQANHLATLTVMGMASLLWIFESRRCTAFVAISIFVLLALGLAMSESRTGLLGYLLLFCWTFVGRSTSGQRTPFRAVLAATALVVLLFVAWPAIMSVGGVFQTGAQVNLQVGGRAVVWPQLIDAALLKPWAGWGLHELPKAHNAVAHAYPHSEAFTYAHNIVLDLVVGLGFPAALVLTVLTGLWLWRRVRAARGTSTPWYCVAVVIPLAVHSLLEFPFAYAYFLAPGLFLLGVLDASTDIPAPIEVPIGPLALAGVIVAVVGFWTCLEYVDVEEDFRVARFEALKIGQTPSEYERPKVMLLTQLDALLRAARIFPRPGMNAETIDLARRAALRFPWPALQNRYALTLALNGNVDEAVRQMRVIRTLHGERAYRDIKLSWQRLASERYPQLGQIALP